MIKPFLNFIIGTASTAGAATAINNIDPNQFSTTDELIKYIISIVGGLLATIIINLLRKKYPEWLNKNKYPRRY